MKITLYTTNCPQCKVLEKKLDKANIEYEKSEDVQKLLELGFKSAPVLVIDNDPYTFKEACLWVDDQEEIKEDDCTACKLT